VILRGRIDAAVATELKEALRLAVSGRYRYLILDLEPVTFIDSSGLSTLVALLRLVREQQGLLFLAGVKDQVQLVLTQTRLNQLFPTYPDVDTAFKHLASQANGL
jgi:anti-sigma B factor antagonist